MATTPRLNMRRPEGGDAFSVHTDLQSIVDPLDNAAIDQQGTLAARPAANAVPQGTYFFTTDELKLYRSDGASWNYVIPDGSVTGEKLGSAPHVRVHNAAPQSIPSGVFTALTYDAEAADSDGMHSTSSNTSRLTCQRAGLYLITATALAGTTAAGNITLTVLLSASGGGSSTLVQTLTPVAAGVTASAEATTIARLAVGDYVTVHMTQDTGSPVGANGGVAGAFAAAMLCG